MSSNTDAFFTKRSRKNTQRNKLRNARNNRDRSEKPANNSKIHSMLKDSRLRKSTREPTKHRLNTKWTAYVRDNHDTTWGGDSHKVLKKIEYIEDFLSFKNSFKSFGSKQVYIMRENIEPKWEAPENVNGGSWGYKIENPENSKFFKPIIDRVIARLIGEQLVHPKWSSEITGLYIRPKRDSINLKIWLKNHEVQVPLNLTDIDGLIQPRKPRTPREKADPNIFSNGFQKHAIEKDRLKKLNKTDNQWVHNLNNHTRYTTGKNNYRRGGGYNNWNNYQSNGGGYRPRNHYYHNDRSMNAQPQPRSRLSERSNNGYRRRWNDRHVINDNKNNNEQPNQGSKLSSRRTGFRASKR